MVEFEADDALAAAAAMAARDPRVDRVLICTPDKDLAQCVSGTRVVQMNRRTQHDPRRGRRRREVRRAARNRFPTTWRSWATPPTAIRACRAGAPSRRPQSWRSIGHLESIPADWHDVGRERDASGRTGGGRWCANAIARSCFAISRRFAPTSRCSTRLRTCAGRVPGRRLRRSARGSTLPFQNARSGPSGPP